jgi:hypothetical protein
MNTKGLGGATIVECPFQFEFPTRLTVYNMSSTKSAGIEPNTYLA